MDNNFTKQELLNISPIDDTKLANEIINEQDINKIQDLTHVFNLIQAKKNVLRVLKLNSLLDKVSDQMVERFENKPDEFSNSDLLNYFQVTQNAIDRANKQLNLVDEAPAIQLNQVNINLDNNENVLSKESKTNVMNAVKELLNNLNNNKNENIQEFKNELIIENNLLKGEDEDETNS